MAKNVALSNEAYKTLETLKRPGESFSDVVIRLNSARPSKPSWREFAGAWKDDKEADKIFDRILKDRHKISRRRRLKW